MAATPEKSQEPAHRIVYGKRTTGQRLADGVSAFVGSWGFILIFLLLLILWIILNGFLLAGAPWDPYPFILLNLMLSTFAAIQAPIILMSQNRSAERDRRKAEVDLHVDRTSAKKIDEIQTELKEIKKLLKR